MAQSRLEKVGTIYSRVVSLIKTKAIKEDNAPLWLSVYEAFPPKYEPKYDRPAPSISIRQIFYAEDKIRAKFHKDLKNFSMVNLLDPDVVSKTQEFILIYKELEKKGCLETEIYNMAVQQFLNKFQIDKSRESLTVKRDMQKSKIYEKNVKNVDKKQLNIDLTNIFDDEKKKESSELSPEDQLKYQPIKLRLDKLK